MIIWDLNIRFSCPGGFIYWMQIYLDYMVIGQKTWYPDGPLNWLGFMDADFPSHMLIIGFDPSRYL